MFARGRSTAPLLFEKRVYGKEWQKFHDIFILQDSENVLKLGAKIYTEILTLT